MSHLVSTPATDTTCPRCRTPLLVALDEGLTARVDATPLPNRQAEITALLDSRWTYTHTRSNHLIHRDAPRIAAGTLHGPIHAEHRCGNRPQQLTIEDLIGQQ